MTDHQPIEEKHIETMRALGKALDAIFNPDGKKKHGFALLVFDLNSTDGKMNYISNAHRDDMLTAMKEFIAKSEGRYFEPKAKQ